MDPEVLFCDPHLLILNKPSGMVTQATERDTKSAEEFGRSWLQEKFQKERAFLQVVGRLDKPVSGIVLCARRSKALTRLNEAMRQRQFQKKYVALVEGRLEQASGELVHFLIHGDHEAIVAHEGHPEAKRCQLSYQVMGERKEGTLVEITLETGRYHQIRAQFGAMGTPVVGDSRYGSVRDFEGIALHHSYLKVPHPMTQEMMEWHSLPVWY